MSTVTLHRVHGHHARPAFHVEADGRHRLTVRRITAPSWGRPAVWHARTPGGTLLAVAASRSEAVASGLRTLARLARAVAHTADVLDYDAMSEYRTEVLDPRFDDGTRVEVDLADPPEWLDVERLYWEAAQAGDQELCRMIEAVRSTSSAQG